MKAYFVFAGSYYYPHAGFMDLEGIFEDLEEACRIARGLVNNDWVLVYEVNGLQWEEISLREEAT
jgi:hypothetical protein